VAVWMRLLAVLLVLLPLLQACAAVLVRCCSNCCDGCSCWSFLTQFPAMLAYAVTVQLVTS
jgi:hypothetical protein